MVLANRNDTNAIPTIIELVNDERSLGKVVFSMRIGVGNKSVKTKLKKKQVQISG